MNSTLLKKYETIDQSKVSEKDKKVLEQLKKLSNNFEETDEAKNKVAEKILDQILKLNPDAVKKPQVVAQKVAKSKKVAKAKKSATTTAKKSGNNIMSVAKEIRKAGETFKDAMERAKQVLKERREGVVAQKKSELEKLYALVKTKKELQGFAFGKSDIERDSVRESKSKGSRVVTREGFTSNQYKRNVPNKLGRKYWESRENRSDRLAPNYPKDTPLLASGGAIENIAVTYGKMLNDLSKEKQFNKKTEKNAMVNRYAKENDITIDNNNIIYIKGQKIAFIDKINQKTGQFKTNWDIKKFADGGMMDNMSIHNSTDFFNTPVYAKGGSTQGYDDREDERLAMKYGKIANKDLDSTHSRRDDARFEERGMMANGGGVGRGIVLDKFKGQSPNNTHYSLEMFTNPDGLDYFRLYDDTTNQILAHSYDLEEVKLYAEMFKGKRYLDGGMNNLTMQNVSFAKGGSVNMNKHIWEGWTVGSFIEELEPQFNQIMSGRSWQKPFKTKEEVKAWCMDNQPYYKKNIPEVVNYFWAKAQSKENYANGGDIKKLESSLLNAEKKYRKAILSEQVGIISPEELKREKTKLEDLRAKVNEWYATKPIGKKMADGGMFEESIPMMREVKGKTVRVPVTEKISQSEINRFVDYVYKAYESYEQDGVYEFTKPQVRKAVNKYLAQLEFEYTWGGGDSLDRERVYQFLINPNLKEIKNPRFLDGGMNNLTMQNVSFAKGGSVGNERMYNFLKDDLEKLEEAIKSGDMEQVNIFFNYWLGSSGHLKSLETKTNERMYNFLKDDLEKLEKAINDGDKEQIDIFFSYWGQHLESLKMADGGSLPFMTDPNFGNFQNTGAFADGGETDGYTLNHTVEFTTSDDDSYLRGNIGGDMMDLIEVEKIDDNKYSALAKSYSVAFEGLKGQELEDEVYNQINEMFATNDDIEVDLESVKIVGKFELGGAFMMTDLAGHTGGSDGLGNPMPLSGVSGTYYTGLVGETGAMSSGELFSKGGSVDKNFDLSTYHKYRDLQGYNLKDAKYVVDRYREIFGDDKKTKFVLIKIRELAYEIWTNANFGGNGERVYEAGGAMAQNQQVINDASQSYVNYYLGEGASQGIYKDGGSIPNNYKGRTAEDVWNNLTPKQKEHFLLDHSDDFLNENEGFDAIEKFKKSWNKLPNDVQESFESHIEMGQYASGGSLGKALYVEYSSYFDYNKYDEEKIMSVLESIGAKNIRLENDRGWFNQPEVVVFNGDKNKSQDALNEAFDTDYIRVSEKDWRTKKMANGGFTPDVSDGTQFMSGVYAKGGGIQKLRDEMQDLEEEIKYVMLDNSFSKSEKDKYISELKNDIAHKKEKIRTYYQDNEEYENGGFTPDVSDGTQFMSGVYANGGGIRSQEELNKIISEKDEKVKGLTPKQVAEMWNENSFGVKEGISKPITVEEAKSPIMKMYLRNLLIENELTEDEYNEYFESGGFVGTVEFNTGDVVWQKDEKRYATVMNNYGDAINGDGGEIRLDTTGNTMIFTYDPKTYENTGYNLVKLGQKGDTGKFTPEVVAEMKESANRLIDMRKERKDTEMIEYYEGIYKRLLDGEFDSMTGAKATASSKLKKYIDNEDINYVSLMIKGSRRIVKGSDVLNGANLLKDGGDLTNIAFYVPKRDVISVTLKNGKTIKPVNGYWVKKDYQPISGSGGNNVDESFKIGDYVKKTEKQGSIVYGTEGFIYEIDKDFSEIKLEDDYGNKNPKSYKLKGFRKLKSKSKNANVSSNSPTSIVKKDSNKLVAPKGYVFVNSGSHRATQQINRGDAKYVSLYSFGGANTSAGTTIMFMTEKDFEKVKDIRGVSPAKNSLPAKSQWFSRHEDKNLDKVFLDIEQKESFGYADGGFMNNVYANGGQMEVNDIDAELEDFDLDNLDPFETMQYDNYSKSMSKVDALQILINTVEGDYSQLSPELAELAEMQMSTEEWDEESREMYGYANGGGFANDPFYKAFMEERNKLIVVIKSRVVSAVGIDDAIEFFDANLTIAPYTFIERAVQSNLITLDEINKELVESAMDEAREIDNDEDLEEIGSSDFTYYLKSVLDDAGFNVGFVGSRLRRLNEDGSVKEIENNYADGGFMNDVYAKGGRVGKMYYHILEYGDYGNIGYQGYYDTKEEAEKQVEKLSDYFPNQTFQIFADKSKNEPPITTMADGGVMNNVYAKGGEVADIQKMKNALIRKAKSRGLYENFGQKEVRVLEDKYGYTNNVRDFDNWAMNYDLSQMANGGFMNNVYAKGGGVEDISKSLSVNELYDQDGNLMGYTIKDKYNVNGKYTLSKTKERAEENLQYLIDNPSRLAYYRKNEYADGGMFEDNDGFMRADNEFNYRYPTKEVYIETLDEDIDLTSPNSDYNNVEIITISEDIDLKDDNRIRARMGYEPKNRTSEKFANINPRAFEFMENVPMPTSNKHKND